MSAVGRWISPPTDVNGNCILFATSNFAHIPNFFPLHTQTLSRTNDCFQSRPQSAPQNSAEALSCVLQNKKRARARDQRTTTENSEREFVGPNAIGESWIVRETCKQVDAFKRHHRFPHHIAIGHTTQSIHVNRTMCQPQTICQLFT